VIATATLGALFGFGGLGRYLVDGVAQNDDGQLFGGVFLVAVLALVAEGGFALLQRALTSPGLRRAGSSSGVEPA
jgi:osmoprotectant transport system permease protein